MSEAQLSAPNPGQTPGKQQDEKVSSLSRIIPAILAGIVVGLLLTVVWAYVNYGLQFMTMLFFIVTCAAMGFTMRIIGQSSHIVFAISAFLISLFFAVFTVVLAGFLWQVDGDWSLFGLYFSQLDWFEVFFEYMNETGDLEAIIYDWVYVAIGPFVGAGAAMMRV